MTSHHIPVKPKEFGYPLAKWPGYYLDNRIQVLYVDIISISISNLKCASGYQVSMDTTVNRLSVTD